MNEKQFKESLAGEIVLSKNPGTVMKKWRTLLKIQQVKLAKEMGINNVVLSDYEAGRRKNPTSEFVDNFVESLIKLEKSENNGENLDFYLQEGDTKEYFTTHEFFTGLKASAFIETIGGKVISVKDIIEDTQVFGYTLIESEKAIVETSAKNYLRIFGKTPMRALIFREVHSGRSTMVALKVGKMVIELKPSMIVFHGISEKQVDPLAIKISESERIPIVITNKKIEDIKEALSEFE